MGDITVGLSTGTSGKRGLFLISPSERESWVVMVMDRILPPKWLKKQKVAFFLRANSNLYTSVQSAIYDFKYFDIFQPIESFGKGSFGVSTGCIGRTAVHFDGIDRYSHAGK